MQEISIAEPLASSGETVVSPTVVAALGGEVRPQTLMYRCILVKESRACFYREVQSSKLWRVAMQKSPSCVVIK